MTTKEPHKEEAFDTVNVFREIKDKISKDLKGMSFDEIKDYLKRNSSKLQSK